MKKYLKKTIGKTIKQYRLLFFHAKTLSFKRHAKKRIIICFNGVIPHGGLVDRLKGIISFYDIAERLNYDFFIQFDDPFELDVFLEPYKLNWKINKAELKYHPLKTKIIYTVNNFNVNPLHLIQKSAAETFLVYANIDYLNLLHPNATRDFIEKKWRSHFQTLFKKSTLLETKLNAIEQDPYICFHTRFTTLMGDFADTTSSVLSNSKKEALLQQLQEKIESMIQIQHRKCYAFSDSISFLKMIQKEIDVHLVQGQPFHMDKLDTDSNLEGHLKTLIDFFMISRSEKVYFLKLGKMYHSSFSKYAAILGNKPFEIITD